MKKILLLSLFIITIYGQGKFSGVTYFDYTYDLTEDAANDAGFGLKRVYFTYKQDLSENISYKFQTDVGQLDVDGDKTQFVAYLKKAQLDWKFSANSSSKLIFGMQGMNIFNVTEKTWGFRFLQKSAMDKYKFSSSADIGIAYSGKFDNLKNPESSIHYSFMYTNGCGYKSSENDKYKKISGQFVVGQKNLLKKDGIKIGASFSIEPYDDDEGNTNNKSLMAFYGGYAKNGLRIGAEFDTHTDDGLNVTQQIIAGYASYKISDKLEGLVYLDRYDPNTSTVIKNDGNTDIIIGVNYRPGKGLTVTPNLRISTPDEGDAEELFMMNFEFKF